MGNKGKAGGKATALILRKNALERYYKAPNYCLYCKEVIPIPIGIGVATIRRKKFCNTSHAGLYNNAHFKDTRITTSLCEKCGALINLKIQKNGYYIKRKYCNTCLKDINFKNPSLILTYTKEEHFHRHKNWQSSRSVIQRHARKVYSQSGLPYKCRVCGYNKHVEISHLTPVKDFQADVKLDVINAISNLAPLCPNHHWEYDKGILQLN